MDSALVFDASEYHQFPNYPVAELEYMKFLSRGTFVTGNKDTAIKQETDFSIAKEIQKVREIIKSSSDSISPAAALAAASESRMERLEGVVSSLNSRVRELEEQIERLKNLNLKYSEPHQSSAAAKPTPTKDSDDDVDLFASDDEEERDALRQQRIAAYNAKNVGKVKESAKSTIILDVKPWDDTTDMVELEKLVRGIATDGLTWGSSKLIPVIASIKKLQIACVVEDDKVGTDFLEESITAFEDHVQSVDIVAFNKV